MSGKRIGYVRVSTIEQNPDRQLENVEVDKKFVDYASAKSTNRPQLKAMLDFVREDDIVIVHSMDRLARNLFDLRSIVNKLIKNKIQVQFIKENLTFSDQENPMSNLMLSLMGAFAEFEYAFIKERQMEGIQIAKKKGKFKGRPKKMTEEMIELLKKELQTRKKMTEIARDMEVSRCTLYKCVKDLGIKF